MASEIERKFLVTGDGWKIAIVGSRKIRDGLISRSSISKVRIRIEDDRASITIKSARKVLRRAEYEYEIPLADADEMLRSLCEGRVVEKTRFLVSHDGLIWEVDVYTGVLEGVILAEVELEHESQRVLLPDWVGREVSTDPDYRKFAMLERHRAERIKAGSIT